MAHNSVEITKATKQDIPQLICLLQHLFSIEKDFNFDATKHQKGLELLLETPHALILIARIKKRVVGMVTVQTLVSTVMGEKVGLIEDFVIDETFHNQKIGSLLFEALVSYARQHQLARLQLVCDNDNTNAKRFYTKKGFNPSNLTAWYCTTHH